MIWFEVRRRDGALRYRWELQGPVLCPSLSFRERVRMREQLLTKYLQEFGGQLTMAFDPAEHQFCLVFESNFPNDYPE